LISIGFCKELNGEEDLHFSKTEDAHIRHCPSDVIAGQVQHSKLWHVLLLEKRIRECAIEVVVAAIPDSKQSECSQFENVSKP